MFICNTCLEKDYENQQSLFLSLGNCEVCGEKELCNNIQAGKLISKINPQKPKTMGELMLEIDRLTYPK